MKNFFRFNIKKIDLESSSLEYLQKEFKTKTTGNKMMFLVYAYIKYIFLYVIIIPYSIALILDNNFGWPVLIPMFIVGPIVSFEIPKIAIRSFPIVKRVKKILLYLIHFLIIIGAPVCIILWIIYKALNSWTIF